MDSDKNGQNCLGCNEHEIANNKFMIAVMKIRMNRIPYCSEHGYDQDDEDKG